MSYIPWYRFINSSYLTLKLYRIYMKRRNNWYVSNDKCSELLLSRKKNKTTRSYTIRRMKRIKGFYKRHWELPIEKEEDEDLVVIRYVLAIGYYKMGGCFSFKKHLVSTYYRIKRLSKFRFNLILKVSSSQKILEAKRIKSEFITLQIILFPLYK